MCCFPKIMWDIIQQRFPPGSSGRRMPSRRFSYKAKVLSFGWSYHRGWPGYETDISSWQWPFLGGGILTIFNPKPKNDIQFPKFVSYKKVASANTTKLVINNALREDWVVGNPTCAISKVVAWIRKTTLWATWCLRIASTWGCVGGACLCYWRCDELRSIAISKFIRFRMSGLHTFLASMFRPVDALSDDDTAPPEPQKKPAMKPTGSTPVKPMKEKPTGSRAMKAMKEKTPPSTPMKRPAVGTLDPPMKRPASAKNAAKPPAKPKEASIGKCFYKATGIYGFKVDGKQKMTAARKHSLVMSQLVAALHPYFLSWCISLLDPFPFGSLPHDFLCAKLKPQERVSDERLEEIAVTWYLISNSWTSWHSKLSTHWGKLPCDHLLWMPQNCSGGYPRWIETDWW